ncbi:hypothetical protein B0T22DRAFT_496127 [Podospora appendiculata]|uniref:Kinesin light chain n=1 Tax=Podospora appendiculata TaxID=314037 RepID=A0AAE0XGZ7_9PEZI|nr:hypothetical protein B0T22DRAFT_496127 [Podospora appendiculata]
MQKVSFYLKTQVALEYAYRRSRDLACSVFWVHADNETTFTQDYKAIAKRLGLAGGLDGPELLTAVRERIEAGSCWLLILDNADNLAAFRVGRTQSGKDQGRGVEEKYSLRDKRIGGSLVGVKRAINVARMTDAEAMELLETVGNRKIGEGERDGAAQLLAELDWFPLAVSQAAAYMQRTSTTPNAYLLKLARGKKRWKTLQQSEFDRHRRAGLSNSILETWDISTEQIRQENEMAYVILHIMIQATALRDEKPTSDRQGDGSTRSIGSGSDSEDDDDEVLHAAIQVLQEFSFLHLRAFEGTSQAYEMYKLVQDATRYALSRRDRREDEVHFSKLALWVITDLFLERRRELWGECEKYMVHAQRAGEWAALCEGEIEASGLLSLVSDYMFDRGRWREKEPVDKRAYEFRRKRLGEKHPDTIGSTANLAETYHQQGRYEEVEKISVEVLALRRDILGEKHPDTIRSMAELAATYHQQGRYEEDKKISVEVLALRRDVLGEKHSDTIQSMGDLAVTYHAQGRYEEDEKISVEVLALQRDVLGKKHPHTIGSMASLAETYNAQGSKKHPDTIWSMVSLAATYHQQGRYEEAEKIQVEVLALRRDVLGEKHPYTLQAMHGLAVTWNSRQQYPEALDMMQECLQLQYQVLGQSHPSTQRSSYVLNSWRADRKNSSGMS